MAAWLLGAALGVSWPNLAWAAPDGRHYAGRSLTTVLLDLQADGLPLVFSSQLVRPDFVVVAEPVASAPRQVLDEVLAPHGLRVEEGAEGTLVVVPAPPPAVPPPPPRAVPASPPDYPLALVRDEIVVRPSHLSLLEEQPLAPQSLSRTEIEALPRLGGDLFRGLPLLPGITANDVSAQFSVRGGRRDEVLVLLDGQELLDAYHLPEIDRALSLVAPDTLAGAELATGSFTAERGDRMGGVLDLTTTSPHGPRRSRLSLGVVALEAQSGGGFAGDRGEWLVAGRRGSTELADRFLGAERPVFWDVFGKLGYRPNEDQGWRAHLLRGSDKLTASREGKSFDTDYDSQYLWLTHQLSRGEHWLAETRLSSSQLDRDRLGREVEDVQRFALRDLRSTEVLGVAHSWLWDPGSGAQLHAGFEGRRYEARFDYAREGDPAYELRSEEVTPLSPTAAFRGTLRGDDLGLFVSERLATRGAVTIELGARYDRQTLTGEGLFSPRLNLAWRLGSATLLRAAAGRYLQSQRPYELQVEGGESRLAPAERATHWLLGVEHLFRGGGRAPLRSLRLEAYRRQIAKPRPRLESLFEPVNTFPEVEPDRVRIAPTASGAEGLELVLRGAAGARIDWWASYGFARAWDRLGSRRVPRQLDQRHSVSLLTQARLGERWRLSLAWRLRTGWPTTPVRLDPAAGEDGEPSDVLLLGALASERLPGYHRLDLRASRSWERAWGRVVFFLDVQNLYDHHNVAGFDLEIDEETGRLLSVRETWPGLFPSIGVRIEL